jgi:hypothetical protein
LIWLSAASWLLDAARYGCVCSVSSSMASAKSAATMICTEERGATAAAQQAGIE